MENDNRLINKLKRELEEIKKDIVHMENSIAEVTSDNDTLREMSAARDKER